MKKKQKNYSRLVYTIAGTVLLYPFVSDLFKQHANSRIIQEYHDTVKDFNEDQYNSLLNEAINYNNTLAETTDYVINDQEYEKSDQYESILNPDNNSLIGYIEIPSINVREPIYHYSTESILEKGIGHIHGSSFPIASGSSEACLIKNCLLILIKLKKAIGFTFMCLMMCLRMKLTIYKRYFQKNRKACELNRAKI